MRHGQAYRVAREMADTIEELSEMHSISGQYDLLGKFYLEPGRDIGLSWSEGADRGRRGSDALYAVQTFNAFTGAVPTTSGPPEGNQAGSPRGFRVLTSRQSAALGNIASNLTSIRHHTPEARTRPRPSCRQCRRYSTRVASSSPRPIRHPGAGRLARTRMAAFNLGPDPGARRRRRLVQR